MTDIELYEKSADHYETLQMKRPDYVGARKAFFDLVSTQFKDRKEPLVIADFCCGTGNNTKLITGRFPVRKATLVDINRQFLDIAQKSGINVPEIIPIVSDILAVSLSPEHDMVISMFAYHHVPDVDKAKFIENAKDALKKGGVLLLGEIYSADRQTTLAYYKHLLNSIAPEQHSPELKTFLDQTANSDQSEYKVARKFAHDQLSAAGFDLISEARVWPTDRKFSDDVGTFVEMWQLNRA